MVILIAAVAENNALGKDNQLVWHLPNDFKRFKMLTSGHYIIMGRKTFESLPKLLPNRTHVVISRQKKYNPEGCIVVESIEKALSICPSDEDVYVIGGGEIYNIAMPFADKLEITRVYNKFDADVYFPKINDEEWHLVSSDVQSKDEYHNYDYCYQTYVKK